MVMTRIALSCRTLQSIVWITDRSSSGRPDRWSHKYGVTLDFSRHRKPTEVDFVELHTRSSDSGKIARAHRTFLIVPDVYPSGDFLEPGRTMMIDIDHILPGAYMFHLKQSQARVL